MKLMKRTNTYKANNVTFDPTSISAFSYNWWQFVKVIEGKVVFDIHFYSQSTSKHQRKVRGVMNSLGITIDYCFNLSQGLQNIETLQDAFDAHEENESTKFLAEEEKKIRVSERAKQKRLENKVSPLEKAMN